MVCRHRLVLGGEEGGEREDAVVLADRVAVLRARVREHLEERDHDRLALVALRGQHLVVGLHSGSCLIK